MHLQATGSLKEPSAKGSLVSGAEILTQLAPALRSALCVTFQYQNKLCVSFVNPEKIPHWPLSSHPSEIFTSVPPSLPGVVSEISFVSFESMLIQYFFFNIIFGSQHFSISSCSKRVSVDFVFGS